MKLSSKNGSLENMTVTCYYFFGIDTSGLISLEVILLAINKI